MCDSGQFTCWINERYKITQHGFLLCSTCFVQVFHINFEPNTKMNTNHRHSF